MILGLYRALTTVGGPLIRLYLNRRRRRGKEDAYRFDERLGIASAARPAGKVVWLHAASVGESISLLPLIDAFATRYPGWSVLVTTGTVTSAFLMRERLPKGAIHQYAPVDRLAYVRRFLDHWQPDLALWAESEFWPNLLTETAARGTPMVLINGRISEKSFASWQRVPGFIARLLGGFALCLGQTEDDARRLVHLGARRAECHGNLKYAAAELPATEAAIAPLRAAIDGRPVWLAASTHPGEEEIAARVHRALAAKHPGLLTLIVPRHPARGVTVADALGAQGLRVARRGAGESPSAETDIYLADTMGELGIFYRLSDIVFIGKTLAAHGGQNPIEPAKLHCALIHGPFMENFPVVTQHLREHGASVGVADERTLTDAVDALLTNSDERNRLAATALTVAKKEADSLNRILDALDPFFVTEVRDAAS